MAGDWIKVEYATPRKPELLAVASLLGVETDVAFARFFDLYCWADANLSRDGHARSVTLSQLSRIAGRDGFAEALAEVGWLRATDDGVLFVNFDRHNSQSAKQRALAAKRQKKARAGSHDSVTPASRETSRCERDNGVTREEKRRDRSQETNVSCCSEPENRSEPTEYAFPVVGGQQPTWTLTRRDYDRYRETFPGLDLDAELRLAVRWCETNPAKRKTPRGMLRFLTAWLERAQNNGHRREPIGAVPVKIDLDFPLE